MSSTGPQPETELADLQRVMAGPAESVEAEPLGDEAENAVIGDDVPWERLEQEQTRRTARWRGTMVLLAIAPFFGLWWVSGSFTFAAIICGVAVAILFVWLGLLRASGSV